MLIKSVLFIVGLVLVSIEVQCDDDVVVANIEKVQVDDADAIPTAVATVYEEKEKDGGVLTEVAGTEATNNTTSTEDEKKASTSKSSVKVQVACWDFRKIGMYTASDQSVTPDEPSTMSVNNQTANSAQALEEEIIAEPVEGVSPSVMEEVNASEIDATSHPKEMSSGSNVSIKDPSLAIEVTNKTVELVNVTYLMNDVLFQNPDVRSKSIPGNCTMVLFHASWCPFCASAGPHYNALPRVYPPLRVVAIDVQKWKSVNTYFGILGVPTVALFHNGKLIAKFNDSEFTLNKYSEFIEYFTDLKHEERINVTAKDFDGPLPSVPEREKDLLLLLAWLFLILTCTHYITKSAIWWRFVEFVRTTWREAELQVQPQQHEHVD